MDEAGITMSVAFVSWLLVGSLCIIVANRFSKVRNDVRRLEDED